MTSHEGAHSVERGWPRLHVVVDPSAEAGALETMPPTPGMVVMTRQELQASGIRFGPEDRVCVTSEAAIELALQRLEPADPRVSAVRVLKDKLRFREILAGLFPDIIHRRLALDELATLPLTPGERLVIKPVKGCFGSGVRIVDAATDRTRLADEIAAEVRKNGSVLSAEVLSASDFLVESFIEGEEYAVDMFYDKAGRPVVTGLYHHPIPRRPAYLHMLYYTSADLFARLLEPARAFFVELNRLLDVRCFPLHAEFRWRGGTLVPIEINSLRFGGMGLGHLGHHALGVNPYRCLIEDGEPDWPLVWRNHADNAFGFVIAYNGTDVDPRTAEPDWPRFRRLFGRIIREVPFDHRQQLAFGVLYVEERPDRLPALLDIDFNEWFVASASPPG